MKKHRQNMPSNDFMLFDHFYKQYSFPQRRDYVTQGKG